MSNETQQTAVDWQFEQLFNSFEKFNNKEYTFDKFLSSNLKIREQAKEMEKEQIEQAKLDAKEIIIIKHTEHGGGEQ